MSFKDGLQQFEKAYEAGDIAKAQRMYESLARHGTGLISCLIEDDGASASIRFVIDIEANKLNYSTGKISEKEAREFIEKRFYQMQKEIEEGRRNV
jgi:hypothetical protein